MRLLKGLDVSASRPPSAATTGRMFIDGAWEGGSGKEWLHIVSPATGEEIGWLPLGTRADALRAVAAAKANAGKLAALSVWERAKLCDAIAARIDERAEEIATLLCREQGKPITEARGETAGAAAAFRHAGQQMKWLDGASPSLEDPNKRAVSLLQPKGVFGVITPWNYPLALPAIYYLAPGIATGNAMVWTPAPTTSFAAALLVECMTAAGVPDGTINLVTGEGPVVGDALAISPDVAGIAFTGSSETGAVVAARAAGKAQLLELGGNGPTIVLDDADLDRAAACIAKGAFFNAGQTCTATERVLVAAEVHDALVTRVLAAAQAYRPLPATDPSSCLGALNNEDNARKVESHVAEAVASGARILLGGRRASGLPTSLYYEPTVVVDVPPDCALHCGETFGPVVPILAFRSEEELYALVAKSPMGLSAALFTRDLSRAFRHAERIRCGIVNVNEASSYWETHIPAGGVAGSASGQTRTGGRHTLLEMCDLKTITFHIGR